MNLNKMLLLCVPMCLAALLSGSSSAARAQDPDKASETSRTTPDDVSVEKPVEASGQAAADSAAEATPPATPELAWSDYTIKAYTLTVWGGTFSGATYLENRPLEPRTILTEGAGDIVAYDGTVLTESRDRRHYDAATKEIKSGDSFGARIGVYISDDFHLDLMGSYASGEAATSMLYTEDPDNAPNRVERVQVDSDPGFKVYRGGLSLMYNAHPASFFGIVPRLGFGLGGIINRFSVLEDKTALYLEGNFGLSYGIFDGLDLGAQVDLTTFALQVDELGYSQMVNYATYSVGLSWFIDRVPEPVRASYLSREKKKK
jgi:hypothetical protein